jgi:hypothetical protein
MKGEQEVSPIITARPGVRTVEGAAVEQEAHITLQVEEETIVIIIDTIVVIIISFFNRGERDPDCFIPLRSQEQYQQSSRRSTSQRRNYKKPSGSSQY